MSWGQAAKRVALALVVHALVGGAVVGGVLLLSQDSRILSQSLLTRLLENPAALDQRLADVRGVFMTIGAVAAAASFLCSAVWLVMAESSRPADDRTARSQLGSWALFFVASVGLAVALSFWIVSREAIGDWLAPGVPIARVSIAVAGAALAYYAATALCVKQAMRASVPGALALLR